MKKTGGGRQEKGAGKERGNEGGSRQGERKTDPPTLVLKAGAPDYAVSHAS